MTMTEKIIKDLRLSNERFLHTLGVADCVKRLAERHFPLLSTEKLEVAALLHDFTKEYSTDKQLVLCKKYNIVMTDEEAKTPKLYHAKTAAAIAKDTYGVDDYTASAIYYHTTGRANMTDAELCLYFADYIEDYRTDKACIKVREYYQKLLAKERDHLVALKKGVLYSYDSTIMHLIKKGENINPTTIEARNQLVDEIKQNGERKTKNDRQRTGKKSK
ncbi:MAG: hypothetical protein CVU97_02825 [Firmicutes bacterium HGW-Firmicutes-21]|nr:MAG: hypothetical protein CVU97_02825 [Firmicutes bacterium HGW-Firmicutes-21]